jgi:hypothetical protein
MKQKRKSNRVRSDVDCSKLTSQILHFCRVCNDHLKEPPLDTMHTSVVKTATLSSPSSRLQAD